MGSVFVTHFLWEEEFGGANSENYHPGLILDAIQGKQRDCVN